jgi:NAD+ kinase
LLHATHTIHQSLPVLGINRGSLGFLTDILPDNLEKIASILQGNYRIEERFLLTATVNYEDKPNATDNALNEVALIPDAFPHMSEFEIRINDEFVTHLNADGLIVATPTGSTAYALSAGGPILHPALDAIVLVSMFPHSLTSRPIVIDAKNKLTLLVAPKNTKAVPRLSCDGRTCIDLPQKSHVCIQKNSKPLHLIHPADYNYYQTLRSKLHWGKQPTRRK